jgi:hypothetical protein
MSKLLTTCHNARLQKMTERMARTLAEAALCLEPGAIKADPDLKKAFAVALAGALGSHALPDWAVAAKVRDCGSCSQHVLFVSLCSWLWVLLSLPIIQIFHPLFRIVFHGPTFAMLLVASCRWQALHCDWSWSIWACGCSASSAPRSISHLLGSA